MYVTRRLCGPPKKGDRKFINNQSGFVPLLVVVALAAVCVGGFMGYQLGDGGFFSVGIGIGVVLVLFKILSPFTEAIQKILGKKK